MSATNPPFDDYSDEQLRDAGMYRCAACGVAVYPNGDPDWKHCAADHGPHQPTASAHSR